MQCKSCCIPLKMVLGPSATIVDFWIKRVLSKWTFTHAVITMYVCFFIWYCCSCQVAILKLFTIAKYNNRCIEGERNPNNFGERGFKCFEAFWGQEHEVSPFSHFDTPMLILDQKYVSKQIEKRNCTKMGKRKWK